MGTDARQVQPEMKAGLVKQREKFFMMFKDFRDVFTLRFHLRKIDTQELCDPASTFFTPSFKLLAQQLIWYRVNTLPLEQQADIAKDEFIHAMETLVLILFVKRLDADDGPTNRYLFWPGPDYVVEQKSEGMMLSLKPVKASHCCVAEIRNQKRVASNKVDVVISKKAKK